VRRRVVITGIGPVAPIGIGREAFWSAVLAGKRGAAEADFDTSGLPCRRLCPVTDPDYKAFIPAGRLRRMDRFSRLMYVAARLAVEDAGLTLSPDHADRAGMVYSTMLGPIKATVSHLEVLLGQGPDQISSANFANTVTNAALAHISIDFNLKGVSTALVNSNAVGYAADLIAHGKADVVLAGFCDEVEQNIYRSYALLGLLARAAGDRPEDCFPFSPQSSGPLLGEGAVVLALEALEHAAARGRQPVAEVLSWAGAHDPEQTFYITRKDPAGRALAGCLRRALAAAGVDPGQVGFVSGYAPGAPAADSSEAAALAGAGLGVGSGATVAPLKRLIGETMGAAEGFAAAEAALVLRYGQRPGYVDYPTNPDLPIRLATGGPAAGEVRYALANAAKLGGNTQAVLLARCG